LQQQEETFSRSSRSSNTSTWKDTLGLLSARQDEEFYLLTAALCKPLCAASANVLCLLAAEAPASLLQQVRNVVG
jgi:hypothetical protein